MSKTEVNVNYDPENEGEGDLLADALGHLSDGEVQVAGVLAVMAVAEAVRDVATLLDVLVGDDTGEGDAGPERIVLGGLQDE